MDHYSPSPIHFQEIRAEDEPPLIGPGHVPPVEVRTLIAQIVNRRGDGWGAERISAALRRYHGQHVSADTVQHCLNNRRILLDNLP